MTLGYLQLHRYNAQPLGKHITASKPKAKTQQPTKPTTEREIILYCLRPGRPMTYADLHNRAKDLGYRLSSNVILRRYIAQMAQAGVLEVELAPDNTPIITLLETPKEAVPTRKPNASYGPKTSTLETIAFIRDHPGCTSADIAKHFNCTRKNANGRVRVARNWANIKTVEARGFGSHDRHWVQA